MCPANLSERLFKPTHKVKETSTLLRSRSFTQSIDYFPDAKTPWYRELNRLRWAWRGISPIESEQVLARIAAAQAKRSHDRWLDTVIGYCPGNWHYEWVIQGMEWQQQAISLMHDEPEKAGKNWLVAHHLYNIAAYPFLSGDELAEQVRLLANRAYGEAISLLPYQVKSLSFAVNTKQIECKLYLPAETERAYPTVVLCQGLDNTHSDYYRLFHDYLAPMGIAMLVLAPSTGKGTASNSLTEDTSYLHQQLLNMLPTIPWIDTDKVFLLGIRFGANIAVRLAYLAAEKIKAIACIEPVVHRLFSTPLQQSNLPIMYLDLFADRMGMTDIDYDLLQARFSSYSLKKQGLLGRSNPTPMLVLDLAGSKLNSQSDLEMITSSFKRNRLLKVDSSPVNASLHHSLSQLCKWFVSFL